MLILTRRVGETLMIGDEVTVTVLGVKGNQVRIGVNAPKEVAKRMTFDLQAVYETDRAQVLHIFQGIGRWIFISLVPEHVDAELEISQYTVNCRLPGNELDLFHPPTPLHLK